MKLYERRPRRMRESGRIVVICFVGDINVRLD
jgi:hypothetical protein